MSSQVTRNQKIAGVLSIAVLVVVLAVAFWPSSSDSSNESSSELFESSQRNSDDLESNNAEGSQNNVVPTTSSSEDQTFRLPFDRVAKEELAALPTTGTLDSGLIFDYVSPRYEAILGGDTSSGIPISELNNPANSDLPESIFLKARTTAIEVTKAEVTGVGTNKWPEYFAGQPKGICTEFKSDIAGAISLPLPQSKNWIVTYVRYSAKCPTPSGSTTISQQINVYFENVNGTLIPKLLSQVPNA